MAVRVELDLEISKRCITGTGSELSSPLWALKDRFTVLSAAAPAPCAPWDNEPVGSIRSFRSPRWPRVCALMVLPLITALPARGGDPLPWEVWKDLGEIARLRYDHQIVMRSSRCPDGCAYDRHSDGDSRFIRTIGDEGVIFETEGPGAITRIWMTQGDGGVSQPLDPGIRLRLTLDGASQPVVDLPLAAVFGGQAPFTPPLAVDRLESSGGNISYVPLAFRQGCRLSLIGAETARIWFQVGAQRLASPDGVASFTGGEDLSEWRALLDSPGSDPWIDGASHPSISGAAILDPGATEVVANLVGPDSLTALRFDVARAHWDEIDLVLEFDGQERSEMSLGDFFAVGRATEGETRSLMIGTDEGGVLYSYFPMPFFRSATVALRLSESASGPVEVVFEVRRRDRVPARDSGLFGARLDVVEASTPGEDSRIATIDGPGRWVGLFLEAGAIGSQSQAFLEGDERIFADDATHPSLYGTGVEDFFGGGFYFRIDTPTSTPFRRALHGMTYDLSDAVGRVMGMYRLMLTDSPVFGAKLEIGLEGGPVNLTPVRFRAVTYLYRRPTPPVRRRDLLDVGDPGSRIAHSYVWTGNQLCSELDGLFEDEPPTRLIADACALDGGGAFFELHGALLGQRLMLRRRFDGGDGDQRAELTVSGSAPVGLAYEDANPQRRWRERETLLDRWGSATDEVMVSVDPQSGPVGFSESQWELWAGYAPGVCDAVIDGVCDAADVSEAVRGVDGGPDIEDLVVTVLATFD
jgi:hypothetical protein